MLGRSPSGIKRIGRPPKPPEVRRLEGNPGKRRIPEYAVKATGSVEAPEWLDEDAQVCLELIKRSLPPKTFAALDTMLLSAFAVAYSLHKKAVIALRSEEVISAGSMGQPVVNPWVKVLNEQARAMLALSPRLYLDPVARLQLKAEDKPASKFDGLTGPDELSDTSKH